MGVVNVLDIYLFNLGAVYKMSTDVEKILPSDLYSLILIKFSFFVTNDGISLLSLTGQQMGFNVHCEVLLSAQRNDMHMYYLPTRWRLITIT